MTKKKKRKLTESTISPEEKSIKLGEVFSKGDSIIERSLYLVHLLDYTSVYLAELNQVDSVEVKVIDYLKSSLSDSN